MKRTYSFYCRGVRRGVAANAYDFEEGGIYYNISCSSNKTCEVTYQSYANYTYTSDYSGNVVIPETVTYNGTTYSVTSIGSEAFRGCTGLTSVTIPESVTTIGGYAFSGCTGLRTLNSYNSTPPTCDTDVFESVRTDFCTLFVPIGAKIAYSTADQWKEFLYVEEVEVSPVADILAGGNAEATGYYTLDGKQVPTPQRGINIIRYSDGTARKVLAK